MIKEIKKEIQEELINVIRSEFDSLMIFNYVKDLEERIDKAIEKLKEIELYDEYITIHTDFIYDLKNILGDKENENN